MYEYDNDKFTYKVGEEQLILVPAHCDSRVLHGPGHCEYCDKYPEAQQQRLRLSVAFTDEPDNWVTFPDPATDARGTESLYGWGGNQPHGAGVSEDEIDYFERIERPVSQMFYGPTRERHS